MSEETIEQRIVRLQKELEQKDIASQKNRKQRKLLTLALSCLLLSFTLCVYGPLDLFLGNIGELWFSLFQIWWIILLTGLAAFGLTFGFGYLLRGKVRGIYTSLVFGAGLAFWLQGNFLNLDLGIFNGQNIQWELFRKHELINLGIWGLCLALPVALYLWRHKIWQNAVRVLAASLAAIQGITLGILLFTTDGAFAHKDVDLFLTDKAICEVGQQDNVIVFLLDMFDEDYYRIIAKEDPHVLSGFEGFTHFSNSVGKFSTTNYAIPYLLTQRPIIPQQSYNDYLHQAYGETQFFRDLKEAGYQIDLYTSEAYVPETMLGTVHNLTQDRLVPTSNWIMFKKLYRFTASKYLPHTLKKYVWFQEDEFQKIRSVESGDAAYTTENNNSEFYQMLTNNAIQAGGSAKQMKFIHLHGAHYPYKINEQAQPLGADNVIDTAKGVLKIVSDYMAQLKELGLYDDATILILADHGYYDGTVTNPIFMVKRPGDTGPVKDAFNPISHDNFQATVMDAIGLNKDGRYGVSAFDTNIVGQPQRIFYRYTLNDASAKDEAYTGRKPYDCIELLFPDESNDASCVIPTGRLFPETGGEQSLSRYKSYALGMQLRYDENGLDEQCIFDYGVIKKGLDEVYLGTKQAQISMTIEGEISDERALKCEIGYGKVTNGSQRIAIYAGEGAGKKVFSQTITQENGVIAFEVPVEWIKADKKLVLRIEMPDAYPEGWEQDHAQGEYTALSLKSFGLL
ncbi:MULTISPECIES: LTA synthase family protein [unclassified Clostridium]|uniref:LTA synthase family protein n=1 Tax=unclassified Clostridium TaxID=2614128 RepID=UPI001107236B|nr:MULTISPECIES: LTA synthase family protein [unclassified Clostridium]